MNTLDECNRDPNAVPIRDSGADLTHNDDGSTETTGAGTLLIRTANVPRFQVRIAMILLQWLLAVSIGVAITLASLVVAAIQPAPSTNVLTVVLIVGTAISPLLLVLIVIFRRVSIREHNKRLLLGTPQKDLLQFADRLPTLPEIGGSQLDYAAMSKVFVANGFTNCTLCVIRPGETPEFTPFDSSFEARELNEADSGFQEFAEGIGVLNRPTTSDRQPEWAQQIARALKVRRPRQNWFRSPLIWLGIATASLFGLQPTLWHAFIFITTLITILNARPFERTVPRDGWMIMPQRLFCRPNLLTMPGSRQMFDRRHSLMIAIPESAGYWTVHVTDPKAYADIRVTNVELQVLLRAWLSPVTPPPADRMSDLE